MKDPVIKDMIGLTVYAVGMWTSFMLVWRFAG